MEKATSKIAISLVLFFLVIASGVTEAAFVKRCSTNADCNSFPCTSSTVLCVNHICTCEVTDVILQKVKGKCSSVADCRGLLKCEDATLECVHGECKCVPSH
ncbi:hypothetical protein D8674_028439 [Pyrus ussuriensis x Pyrus communis]|uniref:Defensin-like protein 298 n=1 Tax=Pyrus ussuriensis x Pyrus communis TaxID=2448454 RepID=A0A5N5I1B3_9ROSA|nr:hypothetical protein D8674_028439 [Pyrus ussuriensis x Pyrus communis]